MQIFNADGSEASMCGNGLACTFCHLQKNTSIETLAGISYGEVTKDGVALSFPRAHIIDAKVFLENGLTGTVVDTGTPHLVVFTQTLTDLDLISWAKRYRSENNINVTLAKIESEELVAVSTFEKGVFEETLACGTGGAAVSLLSKKKYIRYPSQEIALFSVDHQERIWMRSQPTFIFAGEIPLQVKYSLNNRG